MVAERRLPDDIMAAVAQLDDLVRAFELHPQVAVREQGLALLQAVDVMHRPGLRALADLLAANGLLEQALAIPEARLLFELYARSPDEEEAADPPATRGPLPLPIVSHVGAAGMPAGGTPPRGFVPLEAVRVIKRPRLAWHTIARSGEIPSGEVRGFEVEGEWVLVARLGHAELRAYGNLCPGTPFPLHGGDIVDGILRCPWHGCRFDLRTGAREGGAGPGLGPVPIEAADGDVRVAVPERAAV